MCVYCDESIEIALMAMDGYKFIRSKGGVQSKRAIVAAILWNDIFQGGIDQRGVMLKAFEAMVIHRMILPSGDGWVWNAEYKPSPDDAWIEDEEFVGKE
jgi:hypothetical protein